ncbi:MAG: PEFG-CTERM sorting domain-containing protein [Nitrosotalea sp.]
MTNDELSVGFDSGIISGNNENFTVFVDGHEKGYATSTAFGTDTVITVVTPNGTSHVEIVGTHAAPEFGPVALAILAISIISIIVISTRTRLKFSQF